MARKPATDVQRQTIRRGIQKAAATLHAEQGISAINARAVAARAGVSIGTLYSYFDNLQALMQSLWMEPVERANADLAKIAATTPDPLRRLHALLTAYAEFALANPALHRGAILFVRTETLPAPVKTRLESLAFAALLIAAIEDGQSGGVCKAGDARRIAQLVWAGLHGALALPTNFDRLDIDPPRALAADMIDILIEAVRA